MMMEMVMMIMVMVMVWCNDDEFLVKPFWHHFYHALIQGICLFGFGFEHLDIKLLRWRSWQCPQALSGRGKVKTKRSDLKSEIAGRQWYDNDMIANGRWRLWRRFQRILVSADQVKCGLVFFHLKIYFKSRLIPPACFRVNINTQVTVAGAICGRWINLLAAWENSGTSS